MTWCLICISPRNTRLKNDKHKRLLWKPNDSMWTQTCGRAHCCDLVSRCQPGWICSQMRTLRANVSSIIQVFLQEALFRRAFERLCNRAELTDRVWWQGTWAAVKISRNPARKDMWASTVRSPQRGSFQDRQTQWLGPQQGPSFFPCPLTAILDLSAGWCSSLLSDGC